MDVPLRLTRFPHTGAQLSCVPGVSGITSSSLNEQITTFFWRMLIMNFLRKTVRQWFTASQTNPPEVARTSKSLSRKDLLQMMAQDKLSPAQARALLSQRR